MTEKKEEYDESEFFASKEIVYKEIDGHQYGIKESSAKVENEMLRKIAKVDPMTQKVDIDVSATNEMKILNLLFIAPFKYKLSDGNYIDWGKCSPNQKKELHDKIKPALYTKIIKAIDEVNGTSKDF